MTVLIALFPTLKEQTQKKSGNAYKKELGGACRERPKKPRTHTHYNILLN